MVVVRKRQEKAVIFESILFVNDIFLLVRKNLYHGTFKVFHGYISSSPCRIYCARPASQQYFLLLMASALEDQVTLLPLYGLTKTMLLVSMNLQRINQTP